jgi:hypothetical protein
MIISNRQPRRYNRQVIAFVVFPQPQNGGDVTATTDIPGLPDEEDTLLEITQKIHTKLDEPKRVTVSPAQTSVTIVHTLGRQPDVRSVRADGTVIHHNVQHTIPPTQFTCFYSPAFEGVIEFF